jgi:hypothetical protein
MEEGAFKACKILVPRRVAKGTFGNGEKLVFVL